VRGHLPARGHRRGAEPRAPPSFVLFSSYTRPPSHPLLQASTRRRRR
jgi:hypothetical protein